MNLPSVLTRWFRKGRTRPSAAEKRLLHRCGGDAAQAERLIRHELSRCPELSRATACDAAVDRWNNER